MNLSIKKVESNRNFANKLWNATRFVISEINNLKSGNEGRKSPTTDWTLADSWIWARLQALVRDVERLFQSYQFGEAGRQIYEFFWSDFADWYVEIAKLQLNEGGSRAIATADTLARVLDASLRLLHPYTPFVTEELWGHLKVAVAGSPIAALSADWPEALMIAPWPMPRLEEAWEAEKTTTFNLIQEVVRGIRNLRSEKNVKPGRRIPAILVSHDYAHILREQVASISTLAQFDPASLTIAEALPGKPAGHIALVVGPVEIYLPFSGLVDTAQERSRLEKDLAEIQSQIQRLQNLLAGSFAEKAPPLVVQKERDKLAGYQLTADKIQSQLAALE